MRKSVIVIAMLMLAGSVAAAAVLGIGTSPRGRPTERELQTFLHIGCKHHNHGPKWHDDHARSLGVKPRRDRDEP